MSSPTPEPEKAEPTTGKMTERFRIEGEPTDALKALLAEPAE